MDGWMDGWMDEWMDGRTDGSRVRRAVQESALSVCYADGFPPQYCILLVFWPDRRHLAVSISVPTTRRV